MADSYPGNPTLVKGAFVRFSAPFLAPIPHIVIFQYNPASLTRSVSPWQPPRRQEGGEGESASHGLAQPVDPEETLSLSLELDAADALEEPQYHPVAAVSGVADRISALEMLMHPDREAQNELLQAAGTALSGGASTASGAVPSGGSGSRTAPADTVPRYRTPVTLFIWGPGKVMPVKLTSFSVEEQAFSPMLYPIRAKVSVGLKVLEESAFPREADRNFSEKLAVAAYKYMQGQKKVLAFANEANNVESILNMFPIF